MQGLRLSAAFGLCALVASCASPRLPDEGFSFPVIGDIPYSEDDRSVLEGEILPAIAAGSFPFLIHIGDYKSGGAPCDPAADEAQRALIAQLSPIPVFYTPGDNEWTDCDRFIDPQTGRPQSALERLARLRRLFFSSRVEAPMTMKAKRQPDLPENMTWTYGGVRFATVHVVGTANGRRAVEGDDPALAGAEADRREAAATAWLAEVSALARRQKAGALVVAMHADMFDVSDGVLGQPCAGASASREETCDAFATLRAALNAAAAGFGGPTLLIFGDTAPFALKRADEGAGLLWLLNAAGDHGVTPEGFHYGVQDATLVTFDPRAAEPFTARAIASGTPAGQ